MKELGVLDSYFFCIGNGLIILAYQKRFLTIRKENESTLK